MLSARCPNCSTPNEFPAHAVNSKVGCKHCRHVWRLTTTLPALPASPPPAVPAAYRTESVTVPGVITHGHVTPPPMPRMMPEEITQVEFFCAQRDEPLSALYTRQRGDTLFRFERSEKGTHALDRWCGTESGRQHFQRNGGTVQYDRTIHNVDHRNLSGFSCPWCGCDDWWLCHGCDHLICKGRAYTTADGTEYGVCRKSCPGFGTRGAKLSPGDFSIAVRKAGLSWRRPDNATALPPPPSNRPRLRWRS